jgi:hypothetical protein
VAQSQKINVMEGVTRALTEVGEDLTVTRKTVVADPDNPTMPGNTIVESWVARGYVYPESKWDSTNQILVKSTMVILDPLSFIPAGAVTKEGDVITDDRGMSYKLLSSQAPRLEGADMVFIHPVGAM